MNFDTSTHAGARARETPAPRPDPLGELRTDLAAVLAVLEASPVPALGRKKANKFVHALESAQREVRRALAATGAGSG